MDKILSTIAEEYKVSEETAKGTIELIDEGNTIVFISRYRKEVTGNMDDEALRSFEERLKYLRSLEARKAEIIKLIDAQGKLTDELTQKIQAATILKELEDLYLPYRPKKRTRATIAREAGLLGLADVILAQELTDLQIDEKAAEYLSDETGITEIPAAIAGACDIIAEIISENADYRKTIRNITYRNAEIKSTIAKNAAEDNEFSMYADFSEKVMDIPDHRVLALNRGEKKKALKVTIAAPVDQLVAYLCGRVIRKGWESKYLRTAIEDAYKRLIMPSIETETRATLTERADESAIRVFSRNLKTLLMSPPVRGKKIMGFDPGFRNGCKIAVIDSVGNICDYGVVHLEKKSAHADLQALLEKNEVDIVAIGNGTASREAEVLVSEVLQSLQRPCEYIIVNEAGASVYSASKLATEEYPDLDVLTRGAISIAQRLRDPLAELVKIDPKSIGVGQYQHDVNQPALSKALANVVEDAVNTVGVDVNTASPSLLGYVSGITKKTAASIFAYVKENGGLKDRSELLKINGVGEKSFEQCAGFLRVPESSNVLDNTAVHPESYEAANALLDYCGLSADSLRSGFEQAKDALRKVEPSLVAKELNIGEYTLRDILEELKKPGRDPRDELTRVVFQKELMELKDLQEGMILSGTVRNVTHFGAFVDIGVHQDGLVHISRLSDKYVKDPFDVVKVGDIVTVEVIGVDLKKNRISLSMKGLKGKEKPKKEG